MHHSEFGLVFVSKQLAGKIAVSIPSRAVLEKKKKDSFFSWKSLTL